MVIVILGVIGGMVAVFMRGPIDAYFASARRAALMDAADTAVRRMARDIRKALPNSVRTIGTAPSPVCLEFIPTKTGGRYRAQGAGYLDFGTSSGATGFNELGSNDDVNFRPVDQRIARYDIVVVYNLGITNADAYQQDNTAEVGTAPTPTGTASAPETAISFTAAKQFPLESGSNRFHVVPAIEQVVGYVCSGNLLLRYTKTLPYATPASCPTTGTTLAANVSSCSFDYSASDLKRNARVRMSLQLTDDSGETISLQHEVHVNNTP